MDSNNKRRFLYPKSFIASTGFAAFHSHEYRLFWVAAACSNIGMWALVYGRLWLMHSLTGSTLMVGLVSTATLGPVLIFAVWGGAVADRVNRLRMVQITRGMFAFLALLTGLLIAAGLIQPWHIIAISLATGLLLSFDIPSRSAMLPALLPREHLASGIALYSLVFGGASIVGPIFFAPLVKLWGIGGIFFLTGGSYILTVVALLFMQSSRHDQQTQSTNLARGVIEGFKYLKQHRPLMGIVFLGIIVGLFGTSFEALLPAFSDNVLQGGVNTYSRLLLFEGIGGLGATLIIAVLGPRIQPARYMFLGAIAFGLGLLALGSNSWLVAAVLMMSLLGGSRVLFGTLSTTMMQTLSSDEFRGRVMSLQEFTWGATALGSLMMGTLAVGVGVSAAAAIGGSMVVVGALLVALWMFRGRSAQVLEPDAATATQRPVT